MIDALINDGDIVLMQQCSTVENAEIDLKTLSGLLMNTCRISKIVYCQPLRIRAQASI